MMLQRVVLLGLSSLMFAACSGKGTVEAIGDGIPLPPGGEGASTGLENPDAIGPQSVPKDVPSVENTASYYGLYPLVLGVPLSLVLNGDNQHKIIDLEFKDSEFKDFFMNTFSRTAVGSCSTSDWEMTWMKVNTAGDILSESYPSIFETIDAYGGDRYILRISMVKTDGCSSIGLYTEFLEEQ